MNYLSVNCHLGRHYDDEDEGLTCGCFNMKPCESERFCIEVVLNLIDIWMYEQLKPDRNSNEAESFDA